MIFFRFSRSDDYDLDTFSRNNYYCKTTKLIVITIIVVIITISIKVKI